MSATSEPTVYQRRYLIACEKLGYEPGELSGREFAAWATSAIMDFKARIGKRWDDRLTEDDHADLDDYLRALPAVEEVTA